MSVAASAPGKLILLGEYAVLDGAPAVAIAMPQRAQVRLSWLAREPSRLSAPPLVDHRVEFTPAPDGVHWSSGLAAATRARLDWTGRLIAALLRRGWWPPAPVAVELDTRALHDAAGRKLGLGSSAALAVALARAGACLAGVDDRAVTLAELVALHRSLQAGCGSGVDVAAALLGGVVRYRLDRDEPRAERMQLPAGLELLALGSGAAVSTADALARLRAWQAGHPRDWAALRARLAAAAESASRAAATDAAAAAAAIDGYGQCLAALEQAAGIEIFGQAHAEPQRLAAEAGVAYKPSGAGGDLGIAASAEPGRIEALRQRALATGIPAWPVAAGVEGARVGVPAVPAD